MERVSKSSEHTKIHASIHFKRVNCRVCGLYLFKKCPLALASVAQLVGVIRCTEGLPLRFLVRAQTQAMGSIHVGGGEAAAD